MSTPKKSNEYIQNSAFDSAKLAGLASLKRILERDFFCETTIDIFAHDDKKVDLVIHLYCNFGLTESLFHLNKGTWGNFRNVISGDVKTSPFQAALWELESNTNTIFDIKELSIHLRDTSIIIYKLPNQQIQDNLESILDFVSGNFVYFTRGLSEMPYEIFVPIHEETKNSFSHSEKERNGKSKYLQFWGIYFEGDDDLQVYDVTNKTIIEQSDSFLLNYWE